MSTVSSNAVCSVFFFQAEDGIRDGHVTGVQTCALPIYFGVPTALQIRAAIGYLLRMDEEAIRQREIFCRVEPQNFLRGRDLIAAGSSRVGRGGTAHGGHGMPDSGTQLDKNWTAGLRCLREYAPNFLEVLGVGDFQHFPAVGAVTRWHVLTKCDCGVAVD